jgi:hypothetical protein
MIKVPKLLAGILSTLFYSSYTVALKSLLLFATEKGLSVGLRKAYRLLFPPSDHTMAEGPEALEQMRQHNPRVIIRILDLHSHWRIDLPFRMNSTGSTNDAPPSRMKV